MSETDLLDRIDEVTADVCHQCGGAMAGSVSPWFCGQDCQQAWTAHAAAVEELTGYSEPHGGWERDSARWGSSTAMPEFRPPQFTPEQIEQLREAGRVAAERMTAMANAMAKAWSDAAKPLVEAMRRSGQLPPAPTRPDGDPMAHALAARRARNTGPQVHADPRRNRRR